MDVRQQVLHEAGYRCANPACRTLLTLEIHHLDPVSEGGSNTVDNLLALCPNCHTLHHRRVIPMTSLKAWKLLLLSLNEGFDRISIDVLLAMQQIKNLRVSGDGFVHIAGLLTGGYVRLAMVGHPAGGTTQLGLRLTEKGQTFIEAWKAGDQQAAVNAGRSTSEQEQPISGGDDPMSSVGSAPRGTAP